MGNYMKFLLNSLYMKICIRCGTYKNDVKKFKLEGMCASWGKFSKRHWYKEESQLKKEHKTYRIVRKFKVQS